ncbi:MULTISPECIES: hypothetical protein [Mesonia]|uniref:Uncharacterized protein n=1 Tax=Mesonia oceanica TaxID=2687242 RepID=A0AC61YAS9_9FLAO|nr:MULTISPECIES: hypothetical protein [Mesonia]MAN27050.1 hypothetical protein [Mesonia sp.]MAQ41440.1 hypothetical protein [Mesonia sp.]VVV00455.1 hypothetical protein FVB9532_01726 [Mesonia oceanica]|tara:strand:- start:1918 stop:2223 length:306 start_codon:yes stop_codon:yes gene_type:complete
MNNCIQTTQGVSYQLSKYLGFRKTPQTEEEKAIWNAIARLAKFIGQQDHYIHMLRFKPLHKVCNSIIIAVVLDDLLDDMNSDLFKVRCYLIDYDAKHTRSV